MIKNLLIITNISILALSPLFFLNRAEAKIVPDCGKTTLKLGADGKPAVDKSGRLTNEKEFRACDFSDAMQLIRNIINFL